MVGVTRSNAEEPVSAVTTKPLWKPLLQPATSQLLLPAFDDCTPSYQNFAYYYPPSLASDIAHFYCLCRSQCLDSEATAVLSWLKREAEVAATAVFDSIILPFIKILSSILTKYNYFGSAEIRETCVCLLTKMQSRCVGPEPIKPTSWSFEPKASGSNVPDCAFCRELNAFLIQSDKIEEIFSESSYWHIKDQLDVEYADVSCAPGGRARVKKHDFEWEHDHRH